jgi:hypothetical protein
MGRIGLGLGAWGIVDPEVVKTTRFIPIFEGCVVVFSVTGAWSLLRKMGREVRGEDATPTG